MWTFFDLAEVKEFSWNSEQDIRRYVEYVIIDAIKAAGLFKKVELKSELGIFSVQSNMLVVVFQRFPIGVIEIKKPGPKLLESHRVFGQIYDYLLRLQSFYGLKYVLKSTTHTYFT